MWFVFKLKEITTWDKPNIQICPKNQYNWPNIAKIWKNIVELTECFSKNLMYLLDSEQYIAWNKKDYWLLPLWKFSDCHSFALFASAWISYYWWGPLNHEFLEKCWFEKVWIQKLNDEVSQDLHQWDIITTLDVWKLSHSIVYLWKIWKKDTFIECKSRKGYVNEQGEYFEWNPIKNTRFYKNTNWKYYVWEGERVWWRLYIWEFWDMFRWRRFCFVNDLHIYRKIK